MDAPFGLDGRVAVVTGSGRGIGLEIAKALAKAGATVAVAEFIEENGQAAVEEIKKLGVEASFFHTDVRDSKSVDAMVENVVETYSQVDILVNNAGIAANTPAEDTPDEEWLNVMNINLNGVFWCCRAAGRHMLNRQKGAIVNIASMSGVISNTPQPQAHYNASKAGVILLTKSLAGEWAQRGVRVNAVSPGYIGTDMTQKGMENSEWYKKWLEMTPMNRVGKPVEVANAVWYLASDASSFATGTNLVVDGGYTSW